MTILSKNKVLVAMSGGVDSSVAALLLKELGMEVIGVSMKTHETGEEEIVRGKTCCTASDINDARRVCQSLDIPFYALNFTDEFEEKVIQNFVQEYASGRTPNPCVHCNSRLKFSSLLQRAREMGAYYLATGHYAQKSKDRHGKYHLLRARDREKDQTYFLFGLGQEQLEHVLFPIGKYLKNEVREFAHSAGLKTADKPESQEICFIPDNDHAAFIERRFPQLHSSQGDFVDQEGRKIGSHQGIHAYTIGQRRGLGVAQGERLYVTEIEPSEQKIVLGKKEDLLKEGLIAKDIQWVNRDLVVAGSEVEVKLRHRHQGVRGMLSILDDKSVRIDFKAPEGAVTPGQAAVFYDGEEVLGGGWIEKGLP